MMPLPKFAAPTSAADARAVQQALRARLVLQDDFPPLRTVAGVDVGYDTAQASARASIVVLSLDDWKILEAIQHWTKVDFPYIPGLLSFREIPAILAAAARLSHKPDIWMVDGQGIAHPRRMGIAAHLGVLLDVPTVGVAKSRLTGSFSMPGLRRGDASPLMDAEEQIGTVLRSRDGALPLFVSPGHRMSQQTALAFTLRCLTRYRLPEPTRLADKYSKQAAELPLLVE